MKKGLFLQNNE